VSADLDAFAQRLLRFDPGALIRLRNGWAWGRLPWEVLVAVPMPDATGDSVVSALDRQPRDAQWRVGLPPPTFRAVEVLPASFVPETAAAAARTLQEMTGRAGERAIRDALLDHQVVVGHSDVDGTPFAVTQRLVQAMFRMNFVSREAGGESVEVRLAGPWTGLATSMGQAWWRPRSALTVRPIVNQPISW
jgi:hypothetical protein